MIKDPYKYLDDPRALAEIRKHQWIESQKQNRPIGFASAAVDWITRFGEEWKEKHVYRDYRVFIERRKYRRFKVDFLLRTIRDNTRLTAQTVNISFFGLLFTTAHQLAKGKELCVNLASRQDNKDILTCGGFIERVSQVNRSQYDVFLRFNEQSQREIESWYYLKNLSS